MPRTVFLHHIGQNYQTLYTPYYSGWAEYRNLQQSGYGYNYYEESEMAIDWDNIPEDYTTVRDWYRQVGDTYMEVMPETYTQVPEDLLPRLTELCARNPMNSREEVTAFLQTLFQSTLSYTLTPVCSRMDGALSGGIWLDARGCNSCVRRSVPHILSWA